MSDDLVEFLNARLDEDEVTAKLAAREGGPEWTGTDSGIYVGDVSRYPDPIVSGKYDYLEDWYFDHIARHDPARVLTEVAAKRLLVEFWSLAFQKPEDFPGYDFDKVRSAGRWTIRKLAAVYTDHPDYRSQEWAP